MVSWMGLSTCRALEFCDVDAIPRVLFDENPWALREKQHGAPRTLRLIPPFLLPCTKQGWGTVKGSSGSQTERREFEGPQKLVLEKAEEPEIKLPTSAGSWKKQESSEKTSISALLTMPKPLTVWTTINCGKFWRRWEYQTTWSASWESCMQVRKQQLELDMEQQTGSK